MLNNKDHICRIKKIYVEVKLAPFSGETLQVNIVSSSCYPVTVT